MSFIFEKTNWKDTKTHAWCNRSGRLESWKQTKFKACVSERTLWTGGKYINSILYVSIPRWVKDIYIPYTVHKNSRRGKQTDTTTLTYSTTSVKKLLSSQFEAATVKRQRDISEWGEIDEHETETQTPRQLQAYIDYKARWQTEQRRHRQRHEMSKKDETLKDWGGE